MSKMVWVQFVGHGFVSANEPAQVITNATNVSGNVWDIEVLYTPTYPPATFLMDDQVGSRVVIEGMSANNIPDGPYTLTAFDSAGSLATFRGEFGVAPVVGAVPGATIRIEDFYKLCNDIPDFVTGSAAKERWLQVIENDGFSVSLGQRINVRGGVASFDGFSVSCLFQNTPGITRLLRSQFQITTEAGSTNFIIAGDQWAQAATLVEKRGSAFPDPIYDASDPAFGFEPVVMDKEAIIIQSIGGLSPAGNRELNVTRGVLESQDFYHQVNSVLFAGLQTAQATLIRVRTIETDAESFLEEEQIYSGIVENINFANGLETFSLEVSPQIFASNKNAFAAKLVDQGSFYPYGEYAPGVPFQTPVGVPIMFVEQGVPFGTWRWAKFGDVCLRLRRSNDPTVYPNQFNSRPSRDGSGRWEVGYYVDIITYDPSLIGTPLQEFTADNYVIISSSNEDIDFEPKSRNFPRIIGDGSIFLDDGVDTTTTREERSREALCFEDADNGLFSRTSPIGGPPTLEFFVQHFDVNKFAESGAQITLAHIFESVVRPPIDYTEKTPCLELECEAAQLILQVLTSNFGDGSNGPFDVLPYGVGLGIDQEDIDFQSFGILTGTVPATGAPSEVSFTKLRYNFVNAYITGKETEKINDWLTKNVLQPLNLAVVQTTAGKIKLIDTTNLQNVPGLPFIQEDDLEYDLGGRNLVIGLEYDSSNLFDRISVKEERLWVNPAEGQITISHYLPSVGVSPDIDETGIASRVFSFLQAEPLTFEMPFAGPTSSLDFAVRKFIQNYSNIIPNFDFVARKDLLEVGGNFSLNLPNVINSNGQRGVQGVGIVIDKKTDYLGEQSRYKVALLPIIQNATAWAATGEIDVVASNIQFDLLLNRFTKVGTSDLIDTITNDPTGFNVGDQIVLYDENFVMLSVDAAGNPQPQTILNIVGTQITLNSPFTDAAGVPILPVSGQIIQHGDRGLQTIVPSAFYSFFTTSQYQ